MKFFGGITSFLKFLTSKLKPSLKFQNSQENRQQEENKQEKKCKVKTKDTGFTFAAVFLTLSNFSNKK